MVSDGERRDLYSALETTLGAGPARVMMELLPPFSWSDVARQSDLVAMRGDMAEIRGEMAEIRGEVAQVRGEVAEVKGEVAKVYGAIAELRAEVRAQIPKYLLANIPVMAGVAGLVLAAVKVA